MAIDWKNELENKLQQITDARELPGINAMIWKHLPKRLYKYYALSDTLLDNKNFYNIENFENDIVWLSKPFYFNDPFDSSLAIDDMEFILKTGLSRQDNVGEHEIEELSEMLNMEGAVRSIDRSIQRNLNICCFSERINSVIMWSHYANNHRGFCLEYDFDIMKSQDMYKALTGSLYPVIYSEKRFDATQLFIKLSEENRLDSLMTIKESLYKSSDWMYEHEWRIVKLAQNEEAQQSARDKGKQEKIRKPAAVYLGYEAAREPESYKEIIRIAKEKNIPAYKMKVSADTYKMYSERFI